MEENPLNADSDEIAQSELTRELERWGVLGLSPGNWMPTDGVLGLLLRIDVMSEILEEAGILDMEVANRKMMEISLRRLKAIREELEPQIQQAKLDAIKNGRRIR